MKYLGSKSRIAKDIIPFIQRTINDNHIEDYYEPFCGGCNIIDKIKCKNRYASDKNRYLIALFQYMQDDGVLLEEVPRELYNAARDNYNAKATNIPDWYIGMIGFLASYNGRFFDGGYGAPVWENTKNGKRYRDYYKEAKNNLLSQMPNLQDVNFSIKDYTEWNFDNLPTSVIYCDPPYANTKQYETSKDFNHDEFWNYVREWSMIHYVFVSEENAPDDFIPVWQREVSRSIKTTDKSKSTEKLFVYSNGLYAQKYTNSNGGNVNRLF